MREINVAFNKGLDELAQALKAFPDSLPVSNETRTIGTDSPIMGDKFQEAEEQRWGEVEAPAAPERSMER